MKTIPIPLWLLCISGIVLTPSGPAEAAAIRTQSIQVQAGWNAVFLEVEPLDPSPASVFEGTPIEIVARRFEAQSTVQFIADPEERAWNKPGWGAWYAPSRPDHFLSTLHAVQGSQAYLVWSRESFVWEITGRVVLRKFRWQTDSFNLTGFSLDPEAPPTFDTFFRGANGLIGSRIYRLVSGKWSRVTLGSTPMRSGEAYWIYCDGQTGYQGPLDWSIPGVGLVDFGEFSDELELTFINQSGASSQLQVESVSGPLPLLQVQRSAESVVKVASALPTVLTLPALESGGSRILRLQVRREWMQAPVEDALLRVKSDAGVQIWVPLQARARHLAGTE